MPYRKSKPNNRWSMLPSLHDEVAGLLDDSFLEFNFHKADSDRDCIKDYDTSITGRFTCDNAACASTGWSSKKIAITIRMYPGDEYNARAYHQRCKICNRLSRPILNETYAERVAYRIKKWNGMAVEKPSYSGSSKGPHNRRLCEGCRSGHCSEGLQRF